MKLKKEMLEQLNIIGQQVEISPVAGFSHLRIGLSLDTVKEGSNNIAHFELQWDGLQLADCNPDMIDVLLGMELEPFALTGGGQLIISSELWGGETDEVFGASVVEKEDCEATTDFLAALFSAQYNYNGPLFCEYYKQQVSSHPFNGEGICFFIRFTLPCKQEHWEKVVDLSTAIATTAPLYRACVEKQNKPAGNSKLH